MSISTSIEAVILLAGYGKRMRPLSDKHHKTLLSVGGKPVINRIVNSLLENDICRISVVLGYQADTLREHLQEVYPDAHFNWIINDDYLNNNNIVSLMRALEQFQGRRLLLIEGDLVFNSELIKKAVSYPMYEIMLIDDYRIGHDGTVVSAEPHTENDALFNVRDIFPPRLQNKGFIYSDKYKTLNIYCCSSQFALQKLLPAIQKHVTCTGPHAYYEEVVGILLQEKEISLHALHVGESVWEEIDDPLDLSAANITFAPEARYDYLRRSHGAYWSHNIQDFSYLDNPYFPTPAMLAQMQHHLPELISEYGSNQKMLDYKMALIASVEPENILALNGLSQVYPLLPSVLQSPVSIPIPSFGEYSRCLPESNTYRDRGNDNSDWVPSVRTSKTVIIVNPNNPTGSIVESIDISAAIKNNPDTFFVVDESFIAFSDQKSLTTFSELTKSKNFLVLESLGKSMGIAGLRLGYAYSPDCQLLEELRAQIPIWNINSLAEYFLEMLLKNRDSLTASHQRIKQNREMFISSIHRQEWVSKTYRSQANFVLVRIDLSHQEAEQWCRSLAERYRLLLKVIRLDDCEKSAHLRLPVRTEEQNQQLLKLLAQSYRDLFGHRRNPKVIV